MDDSIIFHHPSPLTPDGASGSQVRPYHMVKAFRELGYNVEVVAGYAAERKRAMRKILNDIERGRRFAFVYSESTTLPLLLTERHHLPLHMWCDFGFFRRLKQKGTPIGLFYRDIFWRYREFMAVYKLYHRLIVCLLHHYDWWQYRRVVDHLFVPSLAMARALPVSWPKDRLSALPPGCENRENPDVVKPKPSLSGVLQLLYVGGVKPPLYDLRPLFDYVKDNSEVLLTVCCREAEWRVAREHYCLDDRVKIVHVSGSDLAQYYEQADAFAILRRRHPYLDFAMPVKVFEALGYGLPLITTPGTETARFVEAERVGWIVNSKKEFGHLVRALVTRPELLAEKQRVVREVRDRHTWRARAAQVVNTLSGAEYAGSVR